MSTDNPFLPGMTVKTKLGRKFVGLGNNSKVQDYDTGVIVAEIADYTTARKTVDKTPFVKMYEEGLSRVLTLQNAAQQVLLCFTRDWVRDKHNYSDRIYMNYKIAVKDYDFPMQRANWQKGIRQLKELKIIASDTERGQGWFFVNPQYLYKGDRTELIKEFFRQPDMTISYVLELFEQVRQEQEYNEQRKDQIRAVS